MNNNTTTSFGNLTEVASHLRKELENKKYILLFAHNGIGKTRLSMEFKEQGKNEDQRDTLYFNAYTEDLFTWDNDLDNDEEYKLKLNTESKLFSGFEELEMDNRIRPLINRYTDFDFKIDTDEWVVRFSRGKSDDINEKSDDINKKSYDIKVSRGEENIFIWCFFLAIVELAMDSDIEAYNWVKYIYIDDPISSLDENNAIIVGHYLAQLLKEEESPLKTVISSHHTLFFNVMGNELGKADKYFLSKDTASNTYLLNDTSNTPFFHHVALLQQLYKTAKSEKLYTYHFNILRSILEKIAVFHGFTHFSECIKKEDDDADGRLHARIINILNHGKYSLFEPQEMVPENKSIFRKMLDNLIEKYQFNPELFEEPTKEKPT